MAPKRAHPDSNSADANPPSKKTNKTKSDLTPAECDAAHVAHLKTIHEELEEAEDLNEAILNLQQAEWKKNGTACYTHFTDITESKGCVKYEFVCGRFPSKAVVRARYDKSTSNLVNHVRTCEPGANPIKKYTTGGDYNVGRFRLALALWASVHNRPHLAVTDEELIDAFRTLQPNVHVPSNNTVGRDIKLILELSKPEIIELFQNHPRVFHVMLDGWTAPNVLSLVGLGVQFVKNNELNTFLIDMIPLNKSHTRFNLAHTVFDAFKDYGIEKRVLGIVGDNANNNNTMMETLVKLAPEKSPLNLATRIRCLAHVLNLVVKAFLSLFTPIKSDLHPDEDEEEYDSQEDTELLQALEEVDESVETSDTAAIEELLNARDMDLFLSAEEQAMAQNAYRKLNRLGHHIFNSAMLREQLAEITGNLKISNAEKNRMIHAVRNALNIEDKHSMLECFSVRLVEVICSSASSNAGKTSPPPDSASASST